MIRLSTPPGFRRENHEFPENARPPEIGLEQSSPVRRSLAFSVGKVVLWSDLAGVTDRFHCGVPPASAHFDRVERAAPSERNGFNCAARSFEGRQAPTEFCKNAILSRALFSPTTTRRDLSDAVQIFSGEWIPDRAGLDRPLNHESQIVIATETILGSRNLAIASKRSA